MRQAPKKTRARAKPKGKDKSYDSILRQSMSSGKQDDVYSSVVMIDGVEIEIARQERKVVWKPDPRTGQLVPYTENKFTTVLDDNGMTFMNQEDIGGCKFGHTVRSDSLNACRRCRSHVCRKHAFFVGRKAYCRAGYCFAMGIGHKILWYAFRTLGFCFRSVLGLEKPHDGRHETEAFTSEPEVVHVLPEDMSDEV